MRSHQRQMMQHSTYRNARKIIPSLFMVVVLACTSPAATTPTVAPSTDAPAASTPSAPALPTGPVTISFQMGADVTRRHLYENIFIPQYTQQHPNVTISLESVPGLDQKVPAELATGNAPTIIEISLASMLAFIPRHVLAPVPPAAWGVATTDELLSKYYFPGLMGPVTQDGQLYGITNEMDPQTFLINTSLFQTAGVEPVANAPKTWDDVARLNSILTKRDSSGRIVQKGFEFNWTSAAGISPTLQELIYQAGGDVIGSDGQTPLFDTEQGATALEVLKKVSVDPKVTNNTIAVGLQDWADQQNAMASGGPNSGILGETINPGIKGNYVFAALPQINTDHPVTTYSGYYLAVTAASSADQQAVANDFIRFMALQPEAWIQYTGQLTPMLELEHNEQAHQLVPWLDVGINELKIARPTAQTQYTSQLNDALNGAADRVVNQGQDPQAALDQAKGDFLRAIQ